MIWGLCVTLLIDRSNSPSPTPTNQQIHPLHQYQEQIEATNNKKHTNEPTIISVLLLRVSWRASARCMSAPSPRSRPCARSGELTGRQASLSLLTSCRPYFGRGAGVLISLFYSIGLAFCLCLVLALVLSFFGFIIHLTSAYPSLPPPPVFRRRLTNLNPPKHPHHPHPFLLASGAATSTCG